MIYINFLWNLRKNKTYYRIFKIIIEIFKCILFKFYFKLIDFHYYQYFFQLFLSQTVKLYNLKIYIPY